MPRWLAPVLVCLALPASAAAGPPWSEPREVADGRVSGPAVLFAAGRGAVFWQRGAIPGVQGAATIAIPLRSLSGLGRKVAPWPGVVGAGRRFTFAGFDPVEPLHAPFGGSARRPAASFDPRRVEPTRGTVVIQAAAADGVAFTLRPDGAFRRDRVFLSRLVGGRLGTARPISPRGSIKALALAGDRRGGQLATWLRGSSLEARLITRSGVMGPVRRIARTRTAPRLDADLAGDGTAVIGWIEHTVRGDRASDAARFWGVVRPAGKGFGAPRLLERYPDRALVGGPGIRVAIAGGRAIAAWTGRRSIRAAIANGTRFGGAHELGLLGERPYERGGGVSDVAVGPGGQALVVWVQPNATEAYVLAAGLRPGAREFSSPEVVSDEPAPVIGRPSAALDPVSGRPVVAWPAFEEPGSGRILVSSRAAF